MLLINPENHKLQQAHNSEEKISVEALFSSSFSREKSSRAGRDLGRTARNKYDYHFQPKVRVSWNRISSACFLQLPVTCGEGRARSAACGLPRKQAQSMYDFPHLIDRGSEQEGSQPCHVEFWAPLAELQLGSGVWGRVLVWLMRERWEVCCQDETVTFVQ